MVDLMTTETQVAKKCVETVLKWEPPFLNGKVPIPKPVVPFWGQGLAPEPSPRRVSGAGGALAA